MHPHEAHSILLPSAACIVYIFNSTSKNAAYGVERQAGRPRKHSGHAETAPDMFNPQLHMEYKSLCSLFYLTQQKDQKGSACICLVRLC